MPITDEAALIRRAQALENGAWEELFHAHYEGLRRFLYFRVGDLDVAEDLASQVFVEAISGIAKYEQRGTPIKAWLFRIARNISADHLRKRARPGHTAPIPATDDDPLVMVERNSERRQVLIAMTQLKDEQREVLALRFIEGLSTRETSGVMGKSEGAIKAMQHRALARMKRILTDFD